MSASSCIIEAGTVLVGTMPDGSMGLRHDVGIRVHEGLIAQIGPMEAVAIGNDHLPRYGSRDAVAMPGLVNSHHHFGITPLMSGVPFAPLELWLPRFRAMRQIGQRLDTLYSAIEMLESGTTTVHHIHSGFTGAAEHWAATTDAVLSAYGEIGMRAGYSFMMRDRNILGYESDAAILAELPETVRDWIAPQLRSAGVPTADYMDFFIRARADWRVKAPDTVRMHLAPANLHWCSDESLQLIFDTARNAGANVHMHLVETERQAAFAREAYGHSAVAHLDMLGCLGPNLTIGHGNWMDGADLDRIAECGCLMCHNASSGLRLGSGIAPVNAMRARSIPVALGIDQSNIVDDRDMLTEIKLAWALHRETGLFNDRPDAAAILQMATEHGAKSAGFAGIAGRLEPGHAADIVLLDRKALERPFVSPRTPIAETVLHRATKAAIDKVFVGGGVVVDAGRVTRIDRDAVMAEIRERLTAPETESEIEAWDMVDALIPLLQSRLESGGLGTGYSPYRYNALVEG
jgi:5-methylthioadenosine/S-adenosylhomocysteine deaminase